MVEYMDEILEKVLYFYAKAPSVRVISVGIRKTMDAGARFYTDNDLEFVELRKYFGNICDLLNKESKKVVNIFIENQKELSTINDIKYSKSNPVLVRGYYCPLPYIKKKGRIISKPSKTGCTFKYYFKDNKLFCIEKNQKGKQVAQQFLFYKDNSVLGVYRSGEIYRDASYSTFLFQYDEYTDGNINRHIDLRGSNFEIEEYEYRTDDVYITRVRFDVKRHMGKRWMITTDYSQGNQYND